MAKKQHLLKIWDVNHMFESCLLIFFIIGALATIAFYYAEIQEHDMIIPTVVQTNVNDSLDGCDLFSGKWVYDDHDSYPLYKELNCPFITGEFACAQHGRLDSMYQHWRWQPHDCNLPRFDPKKNLERLRDKKILFVGDSLNRNQFVSMVCMLQTIIPIEQKSLLKVPNLSLVTFKEYNVSIDFYWAPLLLESNADHPTKHKTNERVIRIDSIGKHAEHWVDADVLVFNSYNWWRMPTITILNGSFGDSEQYKLVSNHYGYNVALELWSTWLHSHVNHTRTKLYFMTMTADHKRGEEWGRNVGTNCFNETKPIMNDGFWASGCDLEMMRILESSLSKLAARGINVETVNISQLTQYRKDAHPSIYRKHYSPLTATQLSNPISYADCSHWCVPGVPDTWNELLLTHILQGQLKV